MKMDKKQALKKNVQTNIMFFAINMMLNFISKTLFIYIFGKEILGLNSVLLSFLGFLNLADLGITSAITFKLYSPVVEKNYQKIKDIMDLLEIYYRYVGLLIIVLGTILSVFLKKFINVEFDNFILYGAYFLFVLKNASTYFLGHKQALLMADEKQYIIVSTTGKITIFRIIIQIVFGLLTQNYLVWLLVELVSNIITNAVISNKYLKEYKHIALLPKKNFKEVKLLHQDIFAYVKPMFFHKIATFIVLQTDTLLISYFTNVVLAGIYSNYLFLINSLMSLIATVFSAMTATIGKVIAENDNVRTVKFYRELSVVAYLIATVIVFSFSYLVNSFVPLWIGKDYLFESNIVLILSINMFIQISRNPIVSFKQGYGLARDFWAPIIEGLLNLIVSILLVQYIGIIGVFLGTLVSNIVIVVFWQPYYVAKKGFNIKILSIFFDISKWTLTAVGSMIAANILCNGLALQNSTNFIDFFSKAILVFGIILLISTLAFSIVSWNVVKPYYSKIAKQIHK